MSKIKTTIFYDSVTLKGRGRTALAWAFVVIVLVFLFAPVITVVLFAFNGTRSTSQLSGLSLHWFSGLASDESFRSALTHTAIAAAVTVVVDVAIAIPASLGLVTRGRFARGALSGVLATPMVVPGLLVGVSLVAFLSRLAVPLGMTTVIIGHVLVTLPLVIFVLLARLQNLDLAILEAARDLGASWFAAFRRILLPMLLPAVIGAALLAVAGSLDEFIITLFTNGGSVTVPVYLYGSLRFGITPQINAIATLMLAATVVATVAASRFIRATDLR